MKYYVEEKFDYFNPWSGAVDMRGWNVHAAPGHHYYAEFDTLEEAQEDMKRLRDDFFMRDGGDCDRIFDEEGEAAADKAREDFVANGYVDDDLNFYGIRKFEVFDAMPSKLARVLADETCEEYNAVIDALDRLDVDYDHIADKKDFPDEDDPVEWAADENESTLGDKTFNARRFVEVCS